MLHKNFTRLEVLQFQVCYDIARPQTQQFVKKILNMSVVDESQIRSAKRKRDDELAELEVDLEAEEPPSKKALRKAKKAKSKPEENEPENASTVKPNKVKSQQSQAKSETEITSNTTRSGFGIWIGNLSFGTTKDDLLTFLTNDADHPISKEQITRLHMPNGPEKFGKPQNKGFAYVDFIDQITLNHGLQLSEKLLGGRRVLIKDAKSFEGRPASKEAVASGKPPSRRIFVGNLSFDTTVEALEQHFAPCGTIAKSQMATFEDSGKCKGYAWVEFEQLSSAQNAMRGWVEEGTDGGVKHSKKRVWLKKLDGRPLRMEFAEDPTTRYNKRYGKDAKKSGSDAQRETDTEAQQEAIVEVQDNSTKQREVRPKKEKKPKTYGGYTESTVQKLTGAIAESKGTKVTFD